jgi:CDGSH-type Zn-finger protein
MVMDEFNTIFKVFEGGPLEVSGRFRLVNSQGRIIETEETIFLCRCGGSGNKPFCDDSHQRNGFSD